MPGIDSQVPPDPLPDVISPKDLNALLRDIGATAESLRRDAAALREWINAEPHLPNLTTDMDEWLEAFLITSKNSLERAKERMDKYFSSRAALSEWFLVPPPPADRFILEDTKYLQGGYVPRLLPGGYCLYIEKNVLPPTGSWSEFDMRGHYRRALLNTDGMFGRCKKIRGTVYVLDLKNMNLSIATTLLSDISGFKKWMSTVQDGMPTRVKAIHLVNGAAPNLQRLILTTLTPMIKAKIVQRITIHENLKSLHEYVPPEYLPEEYGGTNKVTMEEMGAVLGNFILSKREWFASRAWMKSDENLRMVKKPSDLGMEGSFRKLEID